MIQPITIADMVRAGTCEADLKSRTKEDVIREMVLLADRTGLLCNSNVLVEALLAREIVASTALPEGVAFPHPKSYVSGLVISSFMIVGRSTVSIPFGVTTGAEPDIFFLQCGVERSVEVNMMVRLFQLIMKTEVLQGLRACNNAAGMLDVIVACEKSVFS